MRLTREQRTPPPSERRLDRHHVPHTPGPWPAAMGLGRALAQHAEREVCCVAGGEKLREKRTTACGHLHPVTGPLGCRRRQKQVPKKAALMICVRPTHAAPGARTRAHPAPSWLLGTDAPPDERLEPPRLSVQSTSRTPRRRTHAHAQTASAAAAAAAALRADATRRVRRSAAWDGARGKTRRTQRMPSPPLPSCRIANTRQVAAALPTSSVEDPRPCGHAPRHPRSRRAPPASRRRHSSPHPRRITSPATPPHRPHASSSTSARSRSRPRPLAKPSLWP